MASSDPITPQGCGCILVIVWLGFVIDGLGSGSWWGYVLLGAPLGIGFTTARIIDRDQWATLRKRLLEAGTAAALLVIGFGIWRGIKEHKQQQVIDELVSSRNVPALINIAESASWRPDRLAAFTGLTTVLSVDDLPKDQLNLGANFLYKLIGDAQSTRHDDARDCLTHLVQKRLTQPFARKATDIASGLVQARSIAAGGSATSPPTRLARVMNGELAKPDAAALGATLEEVEKNLANMQLVAVVTESRTNIGKYVYMDHQEQKICDGFQLNWDVTLVDWQAGTVIAHTRLTGPTPPQTITNASEAVGSPPSDAELEAWMNSVAH